jgi:hypothetical protein
MARVCFIHWNREEAEERAGRLTSLGHEVSWEPPKGAAFFKELRHEPPDAVVIDLSRLPAQGRDFGVAIRRVKPMRRVPIVFVGGAPEKVERTRRLLPDASYATWEEIGPCLDHALRNPPQSPVVPASSLAGYSGTPLPKKLGIKDGFSVALVGAPEGFERTLGHLPPEVELRRGLHGDNDLVLWFTRWRRELEAGVAEMGSRAGSGGLWIIWPKKSSGVQSDLTQASVRETGLAAGLVDYKVCAVDATWSGLRFTRRNSR